MTRDVLLWEETGMKLHKSFIGVLREQSDVTPGNVYPAKGGSKSPGTEYWLVVATSTNGAHCVGFDAEGNPVSTANYLRGALRERPLLGKVNMSSIILELASQDVKYEP